MQDGRNLFFPQESFLGTDWQVDETLDLLDSMSVIDKTIVVGLYADRREEEYTAAGLPRVRPLHRRRGQAINRFAVQNSDWRFGHGRDGVVTGRRRSFFMAWSGPRSSGVSLVFRARSAGGRT
jgi:hypothetical protein